MINYNIIPWVECEMWEYSKYNVTMQTTPESGSNLTFALEQFLVNLEHGIINLFW